MIHRVSKAGWWSLLRTQYFRVYHLPSQRGRNGALIQSGSRDHKAPARRRSMQNPPKAMKPPRYPNIHITLGSLGAEARDRLSQDQPQRQRWSLRAPPRLVQPTEGFCILLHSPPHRVSTAVGDFTKLLCFIHVYTSRYVYTYTDTGPHISVIFICCNIAYTVNTSILLQ